jgi:hypothetical protein
MDTTAIRKGGVLFARSMADFSRDSSNPLTHGIKRRLNKYGRKKKPSWIFGKPFHLFIGNVSGHEKNDGD